MRTPAEDPPPDHQNPHPAPTPDPTPPSSATPPNDRTPNELLARMHAGDREAVGQFIQIYGDRIRRRVRGQLRPDVRRVFDSQEILSTVARRLDELVSNRLLRASEEAQLWSLIFRIATNAVVDKSRAIDRLRRAEGPDRVFALRLLSQIEDADAADESELLRILDMVHDPTDRKILEMWLRDMSLGAIAEALAIPPGTVRRRWGNVKADLERRAREQRDPQ